MKIIKLVCAFLIVILCSILSFADIPFEVTLIAGYSMWRIVDDEVK